MKNTESIGILAHLFLHAQGDIQGPVGMSFMSNGSPEQGRGAIAQRLGDVAFLLMHGVHHQLQGQINFERAIGHPAALLQERHNLV